MDKVKIGLVCLITGILIGYFVLPQKKPDVKTISNIVDLTEQEISTTAITIDSRSIITGGTSATINPSGSTTISGTNLSIDTNSHTASTTLTIWEIQYKEIFKEKIVNYTGSVYLMWDIITPMSYYPSTVGITYSIVTPISVIAEYDINDRRVRIGLQLAF